LAKIVASCELPDKIRSAILALLEAAREGA
jgi:hypothetical protein